MRAGLFKWTLMQSDRKWIFTWNFATYVHHTHFSWLYQCQWMRVLVEAMERDREIMFSFDHLTIYLYAVCVCHKRRRFYMCIEIKTVNNEPNIEYCVCAEKKRKRNECNERQTTRVFVWLCRNIMFNSNVLDTNGVLCAHLGPIALNLNCRGWDFLLKFTLLPVIGFWDEIIILCVYKHMASNTKSFSFYSFSSTASEAVHTFDQSLISHLKYECVDYSTYFVVRLIRSEWLGTRHMAHQDSRSNIN